MAIGSKYIEDEYKDKLIKYKYKGGDDSILCYFVINPFCNFLVNYFPTWLAPNVITVSGFFFNLLNLIITVYYSGWKGGAYIPPWACYVCALSYTTYIIFDYSDGKQARRLKASSPLGLLVDHGTDACTTFYVSIVTGAITYFTNIYQYLLFYIPISMTFFLNTWEEYYVGELVLPIINGIAEGTLYADIVYIISGLYGKSFYLKDITLFNKYTLKYNEINGIIIGISGTLFSLKAFISVVYKLNWKKKISAIKDTFIYLLFISCIFCVITMTDSVIVKEYPKFFILIFGFQFSKMMGILQLSHILLSQYKVMKPIFLIPLLSLTIYSNIYYFFGYKLIVSIDALLIATFIWNFLSWAHFVYFCSDEICEILNFNRFVLGKRYPNRLSYEELKKKFD